MKKTIPTTVLSGFLGSGKTTLLNNILNQRGKMKVAVIVNDMGEINIDANLIKNEISLSHTEEKLIEMDNGCICCTLRDDLLIEVKRLCEERQYDAIIIESSGISEPVPVAQTFSFIDEESGINLSDFSHIDTMVTVVDAGNFIKQFGSEDTLLDLNIGVNEEDERPLVNLIVEQIEFANVIILNKIDLVTPKEKKYILGIIRSLQVDAKIIETTESNVDINEIINTGKFDFEKASLSALWIKELELGGHKSHVSELDEYGVKSFVYRPERPFHPERFAKICAIDWPGVIRSKGLVWLASRNNFAGNWSQAGGSIRLDGMGRWISSLTHQEKSELNVSYDAEYEEEFGGKLHGDRRTEIVIIGVGMDEKVVKEILNSSLVTDEEFNDPDSWKSFIDQFPAWL